MSKLHYLLIVLVLTAVGVGVVYHLNHAARASYALVAQETVKKIDIRLQYAYDELNRFPDSAGEFQSLVLNKLDLHKYEGKITVIDFKPGDATRPACFKIKAGTSGKESIITIDYYGSDYNINPLLKGKLFPHK